MTDRVVHVFPRSPFLSFTSRLFEEALPRANTFLVYGSRPEGSAYTVPPGVRCEWIHPDTDGARRMKQELARADTAIFHSVGAFAARLLLSTPPSVRRVWSGWGGDYYGSAGSPSAGLLRRETDRYLRRAASPRIRAQRHLRARWINRVLGPAARATDVFSAPIPDDLSVFRRRFPTFRGRYSQINYATVEDTFAVGAGSVRGDHILLGNSASVTGNHLDVLPTLASLHQSGRRIIAPLSYGDPAFAGAVAALGRRLYGDDFVPVREFLPLAEYQNLIQECGTVVMGHRRQQGIGNVASAMWAGARVFLDGRNPLYEFLRDRGSIVSRLPEEGSPVPELPALTAQDKAKNREVLATFWAREVAVRNVRALMGSQPVP